MAVDVDEMEDLAIHPEPEPSSPFHAEDNGEDEPLPKPRRRRRLRVQAKEESIKELPTEVKTVRRQRKPDPLPSLLAMGWGAIGLGVATFGHMLPDPLGQAAPAAGRMMQLQAKTGAGSTLNTALKKTPLYASIKPLVRALNPYAEIAGLIAGPLMVGAIAMRPEILTLPPVQGVAMMVLLPAVRQASEQAETELTAGIGEYSKQEIMQAQALLNYLVSGKLEEEPEVRPKENVTAESAGS